MTPDGIIYDCVFKELINNGHQQRDAGYAAAEAVRLYRHNTPHKKAIEKALKQAKETYKIKKLKNYKLK